MLRTEGRAFLRRSVPRRQRFSCASFSFVFIRVHSWLTLLLAAIPPRVHSWSELQLRHQLHHRCVDRPEGELRKQPEHEHQGNCRQHDPSLGLGQVGERRPFLIQRSVEHALDDRQDKHRRDQQSQRGKRRRPGRQREHAFENQEFPDKPVETRQSERRKKRDAHQSAEHRRDPAQAAEVVQTAQAAGAPFDETQKTEHGRRGQPVIEHLEQHAVEQGSLLQGEAGVVPGQLRQRKNAEQTVAEVIDGRVGKRPFQIALREGGGGAKDNRDHREPEQRRQYQPHLLRKNRQQDPQETIDAHLRHQPREQHRHRRGRFRVGQRQPGVERHQRHFDRESEECAGENYEGQSLLSQVIPAQKLHLQRRLQFTRSSQFTQPNEIEGSDRLINGEKRQQQRDASDHRVNKKLGRRLVALRSAPQPDEKKRRNEAQFPENEPVKKVESREGPEQPRLEKKDQRKIERRFLFDRPGSQQGHRYHNRRQQDQQQTDSINGDKIFNTERGNPGAPLDEL